MSKKKKPINLLNTISNSITNIHLIKQNQYILISISGGQDSICVFFIFLQLKKQWKWAFGIIYCNHLWHKNTFFANLLVVQLAYIFKIPIYCAITSNKIFNEHHSRHWRYDTFYRISCFYNYKIITTGHTSSDKVETILFQLIRGTSTKSLTSLNFIKYFFSVNNFSKNDKIQTHYLYNYTEFQKITTHKSFHQNYFLKIFIKKTDILSNSHLLVRPILNLHRFDSKKLSIFWELPIYPDISNKKTHYYRNRIRRQLLPTLRFFFNPQIDSILLQFAEILTTEQVYLDITTNRLKYEFKLKNKDITQLNSSLFHGIPLAIQRKLVKKFLETYICKQVCFLQIEYTLQKIINLTFVKPKKIKQNFDILNIYQFYWIPYRNKKKKKISLLNLYLSNKNIYTCFPYKKRIFSKYIYFLKKQFFLSSLNKLKNRIDFFFVKKTNKQSLQFLKKKKNSFDFLKLTKKNITVNNKTQFNSPQSFDNKIGTFKMQKFFLYTYYFQKMEFFIYPEIGILFYFPKKLVFLNS